MTTKWNIRAEEHRTNYLDLVGEFVVLDKILDLEALKEQRMGGCLPAVFGGGMAYLDGEIIENNDGSIVKLLLIFSTYEMR